MSSVIGSRSPLPTDNSLDHDQAPAAPIHLPERALSCYSSPTRLSPSVPNLASSNARSAQARFKLPTHLHRAANPLASTDKALVDLRRRARLRPRRRHQEPRKPRSYSSYQALPSHDLRCERYEPLVRIWARHIATRAPGCRASRAIAHPEP
jgi:hypothetical protein